ncbi:N(4)-(Beta-N-acetylglucosaminyl)-L-asparaginase-like isoform X2 [Halichondria panicea]|uniref:N(4)-(Beta-N-acetylglucosaminyl)-L-asparaginase- like isoform X2 n=1 Tax=Halichondria panicea TaxID=6063 RepID=UPI00312B91F0
MSCIGTWSFALDAVTSAAFEIQTNANVGCIDVLEKAINVVEDNPDTGKYYIGRGCYPNSEGVVQLDAAIMRGSDCSVGAVAALERYAKPISVARRVLEKSSANILVGEGATQFAREQQFLLEDNDSLLIPETKQAYEEYKRKHTLPKPTGHDTMSVLCLDRGGYIAAGVSTSGPPFKPPGRVGDSPLPGCGLYADDRGNVGAAGTIKEWRDYRDGKVYNGFPYAVWTTGMEPTILTQPPCEFNAPQTNELESNSPYKN